jgi:hypothetical protein
MTTLDIPPQLALQHLVQRFQQSDDEKSAPDGDLSCTVWSPDRLRAPWARVSLDSSA